MSFERDGFVVLPDVLSGSECAAFIRNVQALDEDSAGSRTLLDESWCAELARQLRLNGKLHTLLQENAMAVQCTLFDKSPAKNWFVALHQDLSIPVKRRVDTPGCSGWSEKEGQMYVQPPVSVLEQLVAVRVHLDDCPVESGALRVVPGSHAGGRLDRGRAEELRRENGEAAAPVSRGGALVMRPLILHASSKATEQNPRRVMHFVFGPPHLPFGLEWRWMV